MKYSVAMASRAPIDQNLLIDLVENRIEDLAVEYKNFMPLTENTERAKIARHICALSNHGGGWLVFGFEDDGTPSTPHPESLAAYGQDAINGIGAKYLDPQPHCEVHMVTASSGKTYPAVRVPAHGATPTCAKADGPHEKGKAQGIQKGVHYVRAPGPRSAPIESPELWREVIRRCVLAERAGLLASIGQLIDRPLVEPTKESPLAALMDDAIERWTSFVEPNWPTELATNRIVFGFRLVTDGGATPTPVPLATLEQSIRSASSASGDILSEISGAFEPGWGLNDRAKVALITGRDAYARRLGSPTGSYIIPMDWFVRDDGTGVEITAIPEDNPWVCEAVEGRGGNRRWPPGKRLAPSFQAETIAQFVAFVARLAESFPDAARCELVVEYCGLSGRELGEPQPGVYFSVIRSSTVDARRVEVTAGVAALRTEIAEISASLIAPIFRLFDAWDVSAEYVASRIAKKSQ